MPVVNRIADFETEMAAWRRDLHAHPETAFEEHRTAETVARLLASFNKVVAAGEMFAWHPHPMFGQLSGHSWGVLMWRHMDHHLRQFSV